MKIASLSSEELTERLMVTVINYRDNEDKIENFPYIRKGNFAILAQLCVGEKNDVGQYTACLTVTNEMLDKWEGITKEQLFDIAADNSKKMYPVDVQPLSNYVEKSLLKVNVELPGETRLSDVMVITNKQHYNGAAAMFYDNMILRAVAKDFGVDQIVLMPAGINQIYCIPKKEETTLEDCKELYEEFIGLIDKNNHLADDILSFEASTGLVTEMDGQVYSLNLNDNVTRRVEHRR